MRPGKCFGCGKKFKKGDRPLRIRDTFYCSRCSSYWRRRRTGRRDGFQDIVPWKTAYAELLVEMQQPNTAMAATLLNGELIINPQISDEAQNDQIELVTTLTHEYLHHWIQRVVNVFASGQFDNIAGVRDTRGWRVDTEFSSRLEACIRANNPTPPTEAPDDDPA